MKKSILLSVIIALVTIAIFSFRTPAVSSMQFETIGINIYQLPTPNKNGTWTWNFIAWYGVKNNPYMKMDTTKAGMIINATWAKWNSLTMVTANTDAINATQVAADSANFYRKRNYPDVK